MFPLTVMFVTKVSSAAKYMPPPSPMAWLWSRRFEPDEACAPWYQMPPPFWASLYAIVEYLMVPSPAAIPPPNPESGASPATALLSVM